jgi:hypothetical protein
MSSTSRCGVRWGWFVLPILALVLLSSSVAFAEDPAPAKDTPADKPAAADPPPLPLHQFEGNGGLFVTPQAYLVNPCPDGKFFGLPALGYIHVNMGHGRHLEAITVTGTLAERVELGFAWNFFDTGDLGKETYKASAGLVELSEDVVNLLHFNVRGQVLKDAGPDDWMPALTLGVHYKVNLNISDLDDDLMGGIEAMGIEDDQGVDFTLVATKYLKPDWMPVPLIVTAGVRATRAAHVGLLGFTEDYTFQGEFSVCTHITPELWFAAEYKFKPSEYEPVPGLIEREQDWWTIDFAYLVSSQFSVAIGYGHFGWVLNHEANRSFGIAVKFEF